MLCQAGVQRLGDGMPVEVLTDEHKFLHAVAVLLIPVAEDAGFGFKP